MIGSLDKCFDTIDGWVTDQSNSTVEQNVTIQIDGVVVVTVPTDILRPDVNAAFGWTGNHGFSWTVPQTFYDGLPHTVICTSNGYQLPAGVSNVFTLGGSSPAPSPVDGNLNTIGIPQPSADLGEEMGGLIIRLGPYVGDNTYRSGQWTNDTGRTIQITKTLIWTGVDKDAVCDLQCNLNRASDNNLLNTLSWDHYANPTAPNNNTLMECKPYVNLAANDSLILGAWSNFFPSGGHAYHKAFIWFRYV